MDFIIILQVAGVLAVATIGLVAVLMCDVAKRATEPTEIVATSEEDFIDGMRKLASRLRRTSKGNGNGCGVADFLPTMNKAYALIEKDLSKGAVLGEGEKWLYENLYCVRHVLESYDFAHLGELHACGRVPRIVGISRYIVGHSLSVCDNDRIKGAIKAVNDEVELGIEEMLNLKTGLVFAAIEGIYYLAKEIIKCKKMKTAALHECDIEPRMIESNVYLFYLTQNACIQNLNAKLEALGINADRIKGNYRLKLAEINNRARYLFETLKYLENEFDHAELLRCLGTDRILCGAYGYENTSEEGKLDILQRIARFAERNDISETVVAKKIVALSAYNGMFLGEFLKNHISALKKYISDGKLIEPKPKSFKWRERLYILAEIMLAMGICVATYFLAGKNIFLAVLGFVSYVCLSDGLINGILGYFAKPQVIYKLDAKKLPAMAYTNIVISEYITSCEDMKKALHHLKLIRAANRGRNIMVSLLVDLKKSENAQDDGDDAIVNLAKLAVENEDDLAVYIRKRTKLGKYYVGWERKRGALLNLTESFITGDFGSFEWVFGNRAKLKPSYIITLDGDNVLHIGEAQELIAAIAHPANANYDMIALQGRYNLHSIKSLYSGRYAFDAGQTACYPYFRGLYASVFGKDIYTGKGILRVDSYRNKLSNVFADGKLLSHDIIEGALLNTTSFGVVYEDAPNTFSSENERRNRWKRGDIQLISYIFGSWKNRAGIKTGHDISPIYKWVIVKNLLAIITPIAMLGAIIAAVTDLNCLWLFAMFYGVKVISQIILSALRAVRDRLRLRYYVMENLQMLLLAFEDCALIPYTAGINICVLASTIYKLASGKNMLDWKTFAMSQKSGIPCEKQTWWYCLMSLSASFAACLINTPTFYILPVFLELCLVMSLIETLLGRNKNKTAVKYDEKLREYAEKTFDYFKFMGKNGGIIADNLQIKPYLGESKYTSPTNIGFQILAETCGCILRFISREEYINRIKTILETVVKLPKYRGNLYNWYDVSTCMPTEKTVSSVDSGNFVACLTVTKEYLRSINCESLQFRCEQIIKNTDLFALYDATRCLFFITYDENKNTFLGHYNLLASEARLLSFIFMAKNAYTQNWTKLSRVYTKYYGNTLESWTGTMFEYMMAELFLRSPKHSLLQVSAKNALLMQIANKAHGMFGISESGYYRIDRQFRYQYHAFGIPQLAESTAEIKHVISPYSSILGLGYGKDKCIIKNLSRIDDCGAYKEFGFMEAIDCERGGKVVQSYMTHHQGMSLAALTNAITGGKIAGLFYKDIDMEAASIALTEATPRNRYYSKKNTKYRKKEQILQMNYEISNKIEYYEDANILTNGKYFIYSNAVGGGFSSYNGFVLNRYSGSKTEVYRRCYINKDGLWHSPYFGGNKVSQEAFSFFGCERESAYSNEQAGVKLSVLPLSDLSGEMIKIEMNGSIGEDVFYMEKLALATFESHKAHPVFSNMFVISEYLQEENAVIFWRNTRLGELPIYVGFRVKNVSEMQLESNLYNIKDRGFVSEKRAPSFGAVLEPCFSFVGKSIGKAIEIIKLVAVTREELLDKLAIADKVLPSDGRDLITVTPFASALYGMLKCFRYPNDLLQTVYDNGRINEFMYNIRTGIPVLYRFTGDVCSKRALIQVIDGVAKMGMFGIDVSLWIDVILPENDMISWIKELLNAYGVAHFRLIETKSELDDALLYVPIVLDKRLILPKGKVSIDDYCAEKPMWHGACDINAIMNIIGTGGIKFASGKGYVCENGYWINKTTAQSLLPYSLVVANEHGGFVTTENGGGFVFGGNSHEEQFTEFDNDPVTDCCHEKIYLERDNKLYRLNGGNCCVGVLIGSDIIKYASVIDGDVFVTEAFLHQVMPVKINRVYATHCVSDDKLVYVVDGRFGQWTDDKFTYADVSPGMIAFRNIVKNGASAMKILCRNSAVHAEKFEHSCCGKIVVNLTDEDVATGVECCLGEFHSIMKLEYYEYANNSDILEKNAVIRLISPFQSLDEMFNNRLIPQVLYSRLYGKCGYYQVGGAIGFRDQLQDILCLLETHADLARSQILRHASHQYEDGDVMHWWHEPNFGLRSRVSDDKLFLPFAVAEYISVTSDRDILQEKLPYLISLPLKNDEKSRYECTENTKYRQTLYEHCLKAFSNALKFGEHGLLLMFSGDWNDGMDYICSCGKGESVPLSMFAVWTIDKFLPYFNETDRKTYGDIADKLKYAINTFGYDGKQYVRLFGDDGKMYGGESSDCLEIDLLSQSFAVLSGVAKGDYLKNALQSAERLVDRDWKIVKLLAPPLDSGCYLGYISSYPKGVRENGGQYTHAAVWYAMALLEAGYNEKGCEILEMLNPLERCKDDKLSDAYGGEPYSMPADIYSGENVGRMGWSFYTGSASWYYKLIKESFFGVKKVGNRLYIHPKLTAKYSGSVLNCRINNNTIELLFTHGNAYAIVENGIKKHSADYIDLTIVGNRKIEIIYTTRQSGN